MSQDEPDPRQPLERILWQIAHQTHDSERSVTERVLTAIKKLRAAHVLEGRMEARILSRLQKIQGDAEDVNAALNKLASDLGDKCEELGL